MTRLKYRIKKFITKLKWWYYKAEVHCHYFCPMCEYFDDCHDTQAAIKERLEELYEDTEDSEH